MLSTEEYTTSESSAYLQCMIVTNKHTSQNLKELCTFY